MDFDLTQTVGKKKREGKRKSAGGTAGQRGAARKKGKKAACAAAAEDHQAAPAEDFSGQFLKDLTYMLYGFGDVQQPYHDTAQAVEACMLDFVGSLTRQAIQLRKGQGKISTEDILFLLRNHPRMYNRSRQLMKNDKEIKEARAGANQNENDLARQQGDAD